MTKQRALRGALGAALASAVLAAPAAADTLTFNFTGGEQTFTVPAGNSTIHITAIGAPGAGDTGGRGASVSGVVPVSAGEVLYVEVGGTNGFNGGGGPANRPGGGASDVRRQPKSAEPASFDSRLIVAAGGGGGAFMNSGGDAGADGQGGGVVCNGGKAGTPTAGGAGWNSGASADDGAKGRGGDGFVHPPDPGSNGGGGGGGLYGGGGGGGGAGGCGGGGGSSLDPDGGSPTLVERTIAPQVQITYTPPPQTGAGTDNQPAPTDGDQGAPPAPPAMDVLALSPRRFEAANIGESVIARVGTRVTYTLNEPAAVTFTVERGSPGRRVGRRCVRQTRRNRRRRRCTRYLAMTGSFAHNGVLGPNNLTFSGRLNGRSLRPGKYRLVAVATDGEGLQSAPKRAGFTIVRGRR